MYSRLRAFSLCILLLLTIPPSYANVADEKARLAALQQSLRQQQTELADLQSEFETYPDKLSAARNDVLTAEEELATGQRELAELKGKAATDDSPQLQREVPLKEHAIRMLERRVRSEERMLERYQRYHDNLQEDIDAAQAAIAQLQQRIAQQNRRVASAEEVAKRTANAAATRPSAPPPTPAASVEQAPAVEEVAEDTSVANASESSSAEADTAPVLSAEDFEAFHMARSVMQRVNELASSAATSSPRYSNLQLTGSGISSQAFTHLGGEQYQAEAILPSGTHRLRVDNLRFRVNISNQNAGESFVFVADASDRNRLKVNYFKKSLLAYLDSEPVLATDSAPAPSAAEQEEVLQLVALPSGKQVEMSEDDAFAFELAREHVAMLNDMQLDNGGQSGSPMSISGSLIENTSFEFLGQDIYRAEVTVKSGRQNIRINRSSFRIEIPAADDGQVYLFYVDASRPSRLQLTYYKKAILEYL